MKILKSAKEKTKAKILQCAAGLIIEKGLENTTQFIDHSLGVLEALLHSDILDKASDLGTFLLKTHLLSALERYAAPKKGIDVLKCFYRWISSYQPLRCKEKKLWEKLC